MRMCESDDESEVEASTSAGTTRRKCVVLPAFGGETISPRWPLPMGAMMSMMRRLISDPSPESSKDSLGLIETKSWK